MAVLRIDWQSMPKMKSAVVTGKPEGPSIETQMAITNQKPIVVYISDSATSIPQASGFDKIEEIVLTEDKIVIASKAFTFVRMSPDNVFKDPVLKSIYGEKIKDIAVIPSMIFISTDMKAKQLEGDDISVSKVWEEMKSQFKKHYKGDLEKISKDMIKVLSEFDKINNERKVLNSKINRASSPLEKKEIEKELKDLENREKNFIAEKNKIISLMN